MRVIADTLSDVRKEVARYGGDIDDALANVRNEDIDYHQLLYEEKAKWRVKKRVWVVTSKNGLLVIEREEGPDFWECSMCWNNSLSKKELKKMGMGGPICRACASSSRW